MDQRILFWIGLLPLILIVAIVALKGERLVKALPDSAAADSFKKNLWKRYFNTDYPTFPSGDGTSSESRQLSDRLITYLERVIDRTINKARGVLPFNSLIMAVMSIEKNRLNITFSFENAWPSWTIVYFYAVIFGLALSSYKCLELFLVRF
ncbi:MAG TPA: hypothetical protein VL993_16665, partial [Stellaceae bacterium]|nr:hypothetical protein [Stellaceae bacterium]